MSDVNANIGINFDTQQALASLRQLQAGLSRFNQSLTQGNIAAENAQKGLNAQLMQSINATGKFVASQKVVASSTASFTTALEKNQLSMGEYFRFTAAAATANTKVFSKMFANERDIFNRARKDRVKSLQTQYVQLTNANGELVKVLQVVPKHLQMVNGQYADYATRTQMAAQRQQMLNQLLKQGSTQLLNFGKNTQWAGRQLMVGLTVPLGILGSTASKVFREMEQATVAFSRVYGDMTTSGDATNKAIADIQRLAKEFTKYGIAAKDTVELAAKAAAMGLTGSALNNQVISATKLAVLGQVSQQDALQTTISLQNAFGISSDQLAQKINFLNAVENQTVLSIEDLTTAIPKAGPVVKQLGGSVEDLAFFMTAMKEGGINASEGANALKSGLASMINPSKKASDMLAGLGINIKGIVEANAGNLKGTIVGFAKALDTLDPLNRARAIEQMFGKFQFARLSTLFQNVTKDSSQAARALGLAGASVEELAILSERELGKVENAVGVKFQKSIEQLKLELIPIGKTFLQALTPVVEFIGKILAKFNNFSDGTKKAIAVVIGVVGGLAPIALMTFGLLANGLANIIKFFAMLRSGMAKLNGQNNVLGGGFDYLTQQEIEQLAQTNALHTSHSQLISTFNVEAGSVNALAAAYANAASQARTLAASSPGLFNTVPGPVGAVAGLPKKFAKGGVVPGSGTGDTVPSMLTPGEVVLTTDTVNKNPELVAALLNGTVKRYSQSTNIEGGGFKTPATGIASIQSMMAMSIDDFAKEIGKLAKGKSQSTTIAEVKAELTKATERAGQDIANGIKKMLAEASQSVEKTTAGWVKGKVRDTNPATGKEFREPYSSKASTGGFVFAHGTKNANDRGQAITDPKELERIAKLTGDIESGLGRTLSLAAKNGGSAFGLSNFGFMMPEEANKKKKGGAGEFVMPKSDVANLFTGQDAARTLSPVLEEWARVQGITLEQAMTDPSRAEKLKGVIDKYGSSIGEEINAIPGKFDEEAFYAAVERANKRISEADTVLRSAVDNLLVESNFSVTTKDPKAKVVRSAVPQSAIAMRQDLGLPTETVLPNGRKTKPVSGYGGKNEKYLALGGQIDRARADGTLLGAAVIDGIRSESGTAAASPSRKAIKAGKEVADGLAIGMKEGQAGVSAQSSALGSSAVPTAAETQSRVGKMDLGNKAFYDDINTPEMRDKRQILKSQDRQRRKLGASGTVDSISGTPTTNSSFLTVSSTGSATPAKVKKAKKIIANATVKQGDLLRKTVNGSSDTVHSTVKIADQTDKLANITGEAVDAQTQTTGNLLTASKLANITAGNLGDVANATELTGTAQQNVLESTQAIDEQNKKIEEQKRLELKAAKEEFAKRSALANAPIVPGGNQSGNPVTDPSKAMGYTEAYDSAMGRDPGTLGPDDMGEQGFTKDKNGHILFDPELDANGKKQPTKLSKKQITKKKRGMRREKVSKSSGKAAGALGTATMIAGAAGAPPQVTAALGAASTVAQFAPMIAGAGPIGLAVGAVVALGAAAYMLNKHFNDVAAKSAQFAKDLSATRDGLKSIGEMTGKVGSSEKMDKRRQTSQYGKYNNELKVDNTFGKTYMSSDIGKKEKKLFEQNIKEFSKGKAVSDLGLKLATAVSDGVLNANQANSIAANLALELKDSSIEMQVRGQLISLIGPDGKNLKDHPMETRIKIIGRAQQRSSKLESKIDSGTGSRKDVAALAATNMNNIELASMLADQVQVEYETQKQKLEAELASTANAQKRLDIEKQISDLDAANLKNSQFMNDNILQQINRNQRSFDKVYSSLSIGNGSGKEDAFFDASRSQVSSTYKGTAQEDAANKFLNKTESLVHDTVTGKLNEKTGMNVKTGLEGQLGAQRFQAKMEMLVGSKVLSPEEATSYMDLFSGKLNEMDFLLNTSIKTQGTAKTKELFGMFAGFNSSKGKKQATSIITEIVARKKNPGEFDRIMETLKSVQALDGNTLDFEILVTTVGLKGIEIIKKEQTALEKIKEDALKSKKTSLVKDNKIDPEIATIDANLAAASDLLMKNTERFGEFKKLTVGQQTEYLQALAAQIAYESTVNAKQHEEEIKTMAQDFAMQKTLDDGFNVGSDHYKKILQDKIDQLKALSGVDLAIVKVNPADYGGVGFTTPPPTTPSGAGGKGSNPLDFLDALAMRIKNVRDGAFDATKPLQSMIAAFTSKKAKKDVSAMLDMFDGLQQRMLKLKVPQAMRDIIAGMTSEEFTKFAKLKDGKNMFTYDKYTSGKNKGKEKPRTKANIKGISEAGKSVFATMREADLGSAQLVNKETVVNVNEQKKAMNMLMASGLSAKDALAAVEDQLVANAIANGAMGKSGTKEFKEYTDAIVNANDALERQAVLQDLVQKNADFQFAVKAQDFAKAFADAGLSVDQINEVLQDPKLTNQLINDLKDGSIDAEHIKEYLNSIPQRLVVSLQTKLNSKDFSEAAKPGLEFVDQMFTIQEALIRAGAADDQSAMNAKKIKDNEKLIEGAEKELRTLQETKVVRESLANIVDATGKKVFAGMAQNYQDLQDSVKSMQDTIDIAQRDLEMNAQYGSRVIDGLNSDIEKSNREMEMNKDWGSRAVQALQDESGVLSHDLDLINKAAEDVNKQYDEQAKALEKVQQINQNILALQQDQLDLAGALTSGDISAAARAAQKMRGTAANQYATGQTTALEQARQNSLDSLKSGSGMTSKQIQDRQYDISQKIYAMENNPARLAMQKSILDTQDKIYKLEADRKIKMDEIQKIEDAIYLVNKEIAKDDGAIDKINKKLDVYNKALADGQKAIDDQVKQITVMGKDKEGWDLVKTKFDAYTLALKSKDVKDAMDALKTATSAVEGDWENIHGWLDQFMKMPSDKQVNVSVITTYTYQGTPPPTDVPNLGGCPAGMVKDSAGNCVNVHTPIPSGTPKSTMNPTPSSSPKPTSTPNTSNNEAAVNALAKLTSGGTLNNAERALLGMAPITSPSPTPSVAPKTNVKGTIAQGLAANSWLRSMGVASYTAILNSMGYYSSGGFIPKGTDTVPAMLTPGEFIMSKYAVDSFGVNNLKAINNGSKNVGGESVYNYSLTVNAMSNSSPDDIARTVMAQIQQIDSQKIRGVRI